MFKKSIIILIYYLHRLLDLIFLQLVKSPKSLQQDKKMDVNDEVSEISPVIKTQQSSKFLT
jgi:hypothetical protein